MEADEVGPEDPVQDGLTFRENPEDFGTGERSVEEEADFQARTLLA